jgi:hypothetical protein
VLKSANALAQRLPGETDENLAFRMLVQMLAGWVSCLPKVSPRTQPMWYGTALAPPEASLAAGVIPQYSTYSDIFSPVQWPATVRRQKLLLGSEAPLVPWLTSCCWGQMNADELRSATLHSFGSGAGGFSWFRDICFDDPGKLLALSNAVAVAVHHESHLMQGMPALHGVEIEISTGSDQAPLVWSASVHGGSMWLAVTPARDQTVVRFAVSLRDESADSDASGSTTACVVTAATECEEKMVGLRDEAASAATAGNVAKWETYEVPVDAQRADGSTMVLFITTMH